MPFNAVGFCEGTPGTGVVPLAVGGNEQLYRVVGDDLYVTQEAPYVLGLLAVAAATGDQAILRQAKMVDYDFIKVEREASLGPDLAWTHMFGRPLPLRVDKLNALMVNAADEAGLIGLLLGSGKITRAMLDAVNPTHKIHGYSDTTGTGLFWHHIPITWTETLDAGIYEVVGMRVGCWLSSGLSQGMARLSIPGSQSWKPGVPINLMSADHEEFQASYSEPWSQWPLMGIRFDTEHMPNIEVLSGCAYTDENVELTLQKVG